MRLGTHLRCVVPLRDRLLASPILAGVVVEERGHTLSSLDQNRAVRTGHFVPVHSPHWKRLLHVTLLSVDCGYMATKTTVILPDIQYPFHDALVLSKIIKVIEDLQPDAIFQIGDAIDFPQVSRWTKGTAGEYAPTLQKHIDGFKGVLRELRDAAPKARITWLEGNHDLRLRDFVQQYASPLRTLDALTTENLFELNDVDVRYVKGPVRVATNTYAVHGHESSGYASTPQAWDTKFIKRYGSEKSIIFGHTHQPYLLTRAYGL